MATGLKNVFRAIFHAQSVKKAVLVVFIVATVVAVDSDNVLTDSNDVPEILFEEVAPNHPHSMVTIFCRQRQTDSPELLDVSELHDTLSADDLVVPGTTGGDVHPKCRSCQGGTLTTLP